MSKIKAFKDFIETSDMQIVVRATVTEKEKEEIRRLQEELGMSESDLIRAGLRKMGVRIEIRKSKGAPKYKITPEIEAAVRADYDDKMSWQDLQSKYDLSTRSIQKILGPRVNRIDDARREAIRQDYLDGVKWKEMEEKHNVSSGTINKLIADLKDKKKK